MFWFGFVYAEAKETGWRNPSINFQRGTLLSLSYQSPKDAVPIGPKPPNC
jgi:hypothetical protein